MAITLVLRCSHISDVIHLLMHFLQLHENLWDICFMYIEVFLNGFLSCKSIWFYEIFWIKCVKHFCTKKTVSNALLCPVSPMEFLSLSSLHLPCLCVSFLCLSLSAPTWKVKMFEWMLSTFLPALYVSDGTCLSPILGPVPCSRSPAWHSLSRRKLEFFTEAIGQTLSKTIW